MTGTSEQTVRPASQSSLVLHTYGHVDGHQSADGSLVHPGPKTGEGYRYIAPDGTRYQRNWTYNQDGSPTGIIGHGVTGPVVNGTQDTTLTIINHAHRTYSRQQTEYSVTGGANAPESPVPSLESSPAEELPRRVWARPLPAGSDAPESGGAARIDVRDPGIFPQRGPPAAGPWPRPAP